MEKRKIVVTGALPYANGEIHLGHLVEYLQADFWVRFQKMRGHECHYFCADDTHGTPIMISARKKNISPEQMIEEVRQRHIHDFSRFEIEFDNYSSTNSEINRNFACEIYNKMKEQGHIDIRSISQLYCEHDKMFLPDRFVKGNCPKCGAVGQYGDSCDVCSAVYSPSELKEVSCVICGEKPVSKNSDHVFFQLNHFKDFLKEWVSGHLCDEASNKLDEWFIEELKDWDISREEPYFGFEIPNLPGKYFYVWVDAPIGYLSSAKEWCNNNSKSFDELWQSDKTELYHFIGKDILYFHTLFWPAMLKIGGYKLPQEVFVHGFLTINGEKMSKSKGTFINASTWLNHLSPLYLRYYYACKMNSRMDDIDLSMDDFVQRVNSDLIGKITNLASRGAQMLGKQLGGKTGELDPKGAELIKKAQGESESIATHYENRDFSRALTQIRSLADDCNKYFDEMAPWKTVKENPEETRAVLTTTLNLFRILAIYLKPVLPSYVEKVERLFGEKDYVWGDVQKIVQNSTISEYEHLISRVESAATVAIIEEEKKNNPPMTQQEPLAYEPLAPQISIDDFQKVDLRVAKVISAEPIEGAEKLLRLTLDIGLEKREVIAGIKKAYDPATLLGRNIIMIANLAPRKMKFGISNGMVLAAGPGDKELFVLAPDQGAAPGSRVG